MNLDVQWTSIALWGHVTWRKWQTSWAPLSFSQGKPRHEEPSSACSLHGSWRGWRGTTWDKHQNMKPHMTTGMQLYHLTPLLHSRWGSQLQFKLQLCYLEMMRELSLQLIEWDDPLKTKYWQNMHQQGPLCFIILNSLQSVWILLETHSLLSWALVWGTGSVSFISNSLQRSATCW